MLRHENSICPVVNLTKPSQKDIDENDDVVLDEFYVEINESSH